MVDRLGHWTYFLKLNTLVINMIKFGYNWSRLFRGEDFCNSSRQQQTTEDGQQMKRKAYLAVCLKSVKKFNSKEWYEAQKKHAYQSCQ